MDAQQLETHRALLQAQATIAEMASHQEGATEADVAVGAARRREA